MNVIGFLPLFLTKVPGSARAQLVRMDYVTCTLALSVGLSV